MRRVTKNYSFVVIGAGAAGLTMAKGLAKAGRNVVLIEDGKIGGDCTNLGCVPSKTLIAAAERAHILSEFEDHGLTKNKVVVDVSGVPSRVQEMVDHFREKEGPEELADYGVDVIDGRASFVTSSKIIVRHSKNSEVCVVGDKFIIATGSTPVIPIIDGLKDTPFMTNETVFQEPLPMESLALIGGGPMSCELGQAFARLGTKVTIVNRANRLLSASDQDVSEVIGRQFQAEGLKLRLGRQVDQVRFRDKKFYIRLDSREEISTTHLLMVTGRKPALEKLSLDMAGVKYSSAGIDVNKNMQTSRRNIFAIGDVVGGKMNTHIAESHALKLLAKIVSPTVRFMMSKKVVEPSVIYTAPEVAHVGLRIEEARKIFRGAREYKFDLKNVDRAVISGGSDGFVKIVVAGLRGKILGSTIVAPRAGEMLQEVNLAMKAGISVWRLGQVICPYPTYSSGVQGAVRMFLKEKTARWVKKQPKG